MNLRVAVMARRNTVRGAGGHNLVKFYFAEGAALIGKAILQKPSAPAAAIVIGEVGGHVDKIFFAHDRFDDIAHIFGDRIT
jgi:hypothetical protein